MRTLTSVGNVAMYDELRIRTDSTTELNAQFLAWLAELSRVAPSESLSQEREIFVEVSIYPDCPISLQNMGKRDRGRTHSLCDVSQESRLATFAA